MPPSKTKTDMMSELGATGLNYYGGYVQEETLAELAGGQWANVLRNMLANDPIIGAMQFLLEMSVRQVSWQIEPATGLSSKREAKRDAEFVRGALFDDMSLTWQDTLTEILSFLSWGWAFPEIVYKRRQGDARDASRRSRFADGRIGWRKFAPRAQETLWQWDLDEAGGVRGLEQLPPPDYGTRYIPIEKALHFRTTSHKGNPEGLSIYRRAYRPHYLRTRLENLEGVGYERDLVGIPIAWCPPNYLSQTASETEKQTFKLMQKTVRTMRRNENEGVVWPLKYDQNGNKQFDLTLLSTGGSRVFDINQSINRYAVQQTLVILADFMFLGHNKVGSYALSTDKTDVFSAALGAWLDSLCDIFNRYAIPRLMRLNALRTDYTPQLTHGEIAKMSLKELGDFVGKIARVPKLADNLTDEHADWLFKQAKMPGAGNLQAGKSQE